jgi:hypothetical protein
VSGVRRNLGLEALLELDGQVYVVDPSSNHWVKFSIKRVQSSRERPHGLSYSLTLHAADGKRLVGFDNAHPVRTSNRPGNRSRKQHDHKHRLRTIRPYEYKDAVTLLSDFWVEVDAVLKERGVIR